MSGRTACGRQGACPQHAGEIGVDRRAILRAGLTGSILVVALPLACNQGASPPSGPIAAGNVSTVAVDSLHVLLNDNAVLGRDANGLYAMSAVCTHAGCLVSELGSASAGLDCGCHGSRFDSNGAVTHGPASSPLQHYQVDVAADGSITIQGGIPVDASARTPVA
jgi:Rieske Fe-S protein